MKNVLASLIAVGLIGGSQVQAKQVEKQGESVGELTEACSPWPNCRNEFRQKEMERRMGSGKEGHRVIRVKTNKSVDGVMRIGTEDERENPVLKP